MNINIYKLNIVSNYARRHQENSFKLWNCSTASDAMNNIYVAGPLWIGMNSSVKKIKTICFTKIKFKYHKMFYNFSNVITIKMFY